MFVCVLGDGELGPPSDAHVLGRGRPIAEGDWRWAGLGPGPRDEGGGAACIGAWGLGGGWGRIESL